MWITFPRIQWNVISYIERAVEKTELVGEWLTPDERAQAAIFIDKCHDRLAELRLSEKVREI